MFIVLLMVSVDLCADVTCEFGALCEAGQCVCPRACTTEYDPVCASNDVTYPNECEMTSAACREVTIFYHVQSTGSSALLVDFSTIQFRYT